MVTCFTVWAPRRHLMNILFCGPWEGLNCFNYFLLIYDLWSFISFITSEIKLCVRAAVSVLSCNYRSSKSVLVDVKIRAVSGTVSLFQQLFIFVKVLTHLISKLILIRTSWLSWSSKWENGVSIRRHNLPKITKLWSVELEHFWFYSLCFPGHHIMLSMKTCGFLVCFVFFSALMRYLPLIFEPESCQRPWH